MADSNLTIPKKERELNPKQKLFCKYYVTDNFSNATQSYLKAYGLDKNNKKDYDAARSSSSDLLSKPNIKAYNTKLLEDLGFNDMNVDKQRLSLMNQNEDKSVKRLTLVDYDRVKGRISGDVIIPSAQNFDIIFQLSGNDKIVEDKNRKLSKNKTNFLTSFSVVKK